MESVSSYARFVLCCFSYACRYIFRFRLKSSCGQLEYVYFGEIVLLYKGNKQMKCGLQVYIIHCVDMKRVAWLFINEP